MRYINRILEDGEQMYKVTDLAEQRKPKLALLSWWGPTKNNVIVGEGLRALGTGSSKNLSGLRWESKLKTGTCWK